MTFSAKPVAFSEIDELSVKKAELIPVFCIMAIETPPHGFSVMHRDFRMLLFQFPFFTICLHGGMTLATGKDSFCKRRRGDWEFLSSSPRMGNPQYS
jgi:hypothetical protein